MYPLCAGSVRDCRRAADHIGAAHFSEIDRATVALSQNVGITGFRAFDTANQRKHYVEEGVGAAVTAAIASGIAKREDLFLQTKFTYQRGQDHRLPYNPDCNLTTQVRQSIASSLEHLGVTRIDSYILHGPSQLSGLSEADWETWRAMEDAADEGLVGLLGISNVAVDQLKALLCGARIRPTFVQNRCFVRASWDRDMYTLCQREISSIKPLRYFLEIGKLSQNHA